MTISFRKWCMGNQDLIHREVEFGPDFMHDFVPDDDWPRAQRYEPLYRYLDSTTSDEVVYKTFLEVYSLYVRWGLSGIWRDGPCGYEVRDEPLEESDEGYLMEICREPADKSSDPDNRCRRHTNG